MEFEKWVQAQHDDLLRRSDAAAADFIVDKDLKCEVMMKYMLQMSEFYAASSLRTKLPQILSAWKERFGNDATDRFGPIRKALDALANKQGTRQAPVFTFDEVNTICQVMWQQPLLLAHHLSLILGIFGGLRTGELDGMMEGDVEVKDDCVIVNFTSRKHHERDVDVVIYGTEKHGEHLDVRKVTKKYLELLQQKRALVDAGSKVGGSDAKKVKFWRNVQPARGSSGGSRSSGTSTYSGNVQLGTVVGKNWFNTTMIKDAAQLLYDKAGKFTDDAAAKITQFRGHTLRRTGATLCAEGGASPSELQRWGLWKNPTTPMIYFNNSRHNKININKKLWQLIDGTDGASAASAATRAAAVDEVTDILLGVMRQFQNLNSGDGDGSKSGGGGGGAISGGAVSGGEASDGKSGGGRSAGASSEAITLYSGGSDSNSGRSSTSSSAGSGGGDGNTLRPHWPQWQPPHAPPMAALPPPGTPINIANATTVVVFNNATLTSDVLSALLNRAAAPTPTPQPTPRSPKSQ